jgi:hypothetical protein
MPTKITKSRAFLRLIELYPPLVGWKEEIFGANLLEKKNSKAKLCTRLSNTP